MDLNSAIKKREQQITQKSTGTNVDSYGDWYDEDEFEDDDYNYESFGDYQWSDGASKNEKKKKNPH